MVINVHAHPIRIKTKIGRCRACGTEFIEFGRHPDPLKSAYAQYREWQGIRERSCLSVTILGHTVSVAFRRRGDDWYAIDLEFDLVGIGKTKIEALDELCEVIDTYLTEKEEIKNEG